MAVFRSSHLKLMESANMPTDDVSTAGGGTGGTLISASTVGQWMPRLECQETGTVDVDTELQYQLVYLYLQTQDDTSLDNLEAAWINSIRSFSSSTVTVSSSSASDGSSLIVRLWGNSSGSMTTEDLTMNGTSDVTSSNTYSELYRAEIRNATTDAQTTAVGDLTFEDSGASEIAFIPTGYRTASSEYDLAPAATTGAQSTFTNRKTDPGGLTWTATNSRAGTTISLAGPLESGTTVAGIYCRQTAQPGIGTAEIDLILAIEGDYNTLGD